MAVQMKVYLKDDSAQEHIKDALGEKAKIADMALVDIGFGIKALRLTLLLPDQEGGVEKIEERIRAVEGVGEVEVESVSRV